MFKRYYFWAASATVPGLSKDYHASGTIWRWFWQSDKGVVTDILAFVRADICNSLLSNIGEKSAVLITELRRL